MRSKALLWLEWASKRLGHWRLHNRGQPQLDTDGFDNSDLRGYPNNHNYVIDDDRMIPGFDLYFRSQILSSLYTDPLGSLLDIGSCKGWFVLDAAVKSGCEHAVGIDVHEPYVSLAEKVRKFRGIENVAFHAVFLRELFKDPAQFGAPFKNVLIINTYHYLFWGSVLSSTRFDSHDEIIEGLARICSDRVIFANPLALPDSPRETRTIAATEPERAAQYTVDGFLKAASKYFRIEDRGNIGKRNLLVLNRIQ
ncbi:MAG: class I SAM-dependent methyltransferase [Pseudomonadales bacterium]